MTDKLILKKYTNRRLYDTRQSCYVTLSEVAEQIRNGQEVQVLDAKTKEDVTSFILTQILLEEAKNKQFLLPPQLLHTIIQYGDNVLLEFFENHLQKTIESYLSQKSSFDSQFKKWLEVGMDMSEMAQKGFKNVNPMQAFFRDFTKSSSGGEKDE